MSDINFSQHIMVRSLVALWSTAYKGASWCIRVPYQTFSFHRALHSYVYTCTVKSGPLKITDNLWIELKCLSSKLRHIFLWHRVPYARTKGLVNDQDSHAFTYCFDVFLTTSPNILALSLAILVARLTAALELIMEAWISLQIRAHHHVLSGRGYTTAIVSSMAQGSGAGKVKASAVL